LVFSPVLIVFMVLIWLQDFKSPFYIAPRVAKGGGIFKMVKLRSMVVNASKTGVDSTSANDVRITKVGHMIRRYKLDELSQLWNVLSGDMSLVGPRPNVTRDVDLYTEEEKELLTVRPGITDLASIVFADEGEILRDSTDPDLDYNQRIRPWKSRLALLCVRKQSLWLDLRILILTAQTIVSRGEALRGVQKLLEELGADEQLKQIARRETPPIPFPPPGATAIVQSRG
ncbi:MAG: sugar transferase, partial [Bdellovibrionales bacterium]|nr:sugar transferase [Bdellovibrionales bacterium]